MRALHQQSREADGVGMVLPPGLNQRVRRNLDTQIDDVVAVVRKNDLHQILADVMHVALDRGQHDLAARRRVGLLHELLQVPDSRLHGFGRLQHLRHDQLVVVEQPPDFAHAGHQRAVDNVEGVHAFFEFPVQVGN